MILREVPESAVTYVLRRGGFAQGRATACALGAGVAAAIVIVAAQM